MNKFIVISFFIFCQNIYCQEYHFDKYLEYNIDDYGSVFYMLNSKDSTYIFTGLTSKKKLFGYLLDYNKNIIHHYEVKNSSNAIDFNYENTCELKKQDDYSSCIDIGKYYEIKTTQIDSSNIKINLKIHKNEKMKKVLVKFEIILSQSNSISLNNDMRRQLFQIHSPEKLNIGSNCLPLSIKKKYTYSGTEIEMNLLKNKNINTILAIKEEEIKYIK